MISKVNIAEFHPPEARPIRLCLLVSDEPRPWDAVQRLAPLWANKNFSDIARLHLMESTTLFFEEYIGGSWLPVQGLQFLVSPVNRIEYLTRYDYRIGKGDLRSLTPDLELMILRWFFHDLCGLEFTKHLGSWDDGNTAFENLLVPTLMPDHILDAWRTSTSYTILHRSLAEWAETPGDAREEKYNLIMDSLRSVFEEEFPTDDMITDDIVEPGKYMGIEVHIGFEGTDEHNIDLILFPSASDDPLSQRRVMTPIWRLNVGDTSKARIPSRGEVPKYSEYEGSIEDLRGYSDLCTMFIDQNVLIPESQFDAWLDANLLSPVQIFHEVDVEPYLLLDATVPWLLPSSEALVFFTAFGMAVPLDDSR